jgi:hypothetical protein
MQVQMRKNLIAVVTPDKAKSNGVFVTPDDTFSTGVIEHLGPDVEKDLKIGMKVSFGKNIQNVTMGAKKVKVMEDNNVLAVLGDNSEKEKANN